MSWCELVYKPVVPPVTSKLLPEKREGGET